MTTTPNLLIEHITASQATKEVTANEAFDKLDKASNDTFDVDLGSGDVTLASLDFRENVHFSAINHTVARILTVVQLKRLFLVTNNGTAALTVKLGTTSLTVPVGETHTFYTDGTANGLASAGGGAGGGSGLTTATVQTTDATVTNLTTIALASGEGKVVRGYGTGFEPATEDALHFEILVGGANTGGTSRFQGKKITQLSEAGSPPEANWSVDADVDDTGDTIRIRVTGEAAKTIDWEIQFETIAKS